MGMHHTKLPASDEMGLGIGVRSTKAEALQIKPVCKLISSQDANLLQCCHSMQLYDFRRYHKYYSIMSDTKK